VSTQTVFVLGLCTTFLALLLSIHEAITKVNLLRKILQNIEQQEALKAAARMSTIELAALPSAQLAQMMQIDREKIEQLQLELERASMRFSMSESVKNSSTTSTWKWMLGGAAGEEERTSAIAAANRDEHFEQVNPMARPLSTNVVSGSGSGNAAAAVGRLPPPLPPSLRNSFAYSTSTFHTHQPSRLSQSAAAARRPSVLAAAANTSTSIAGGGAAATTSTTTTAAAEARRATIDL